MRSYGVSWEIYGSDTPRTLDSEITIDVVVERAEIDPAQQDIQEDEQDEDELHLVEDQAASINVEEIQVDPSQIDQCGELEDLRNEYLTVSNNKATQSPAMCLNIEERNSCLPYLSAQGSA